MYKRPLLFISYTLVIIFASSFLTAFYFKHYVMQPPVAESLSFIAPEKIEQSPLQDDNTIVEVFSYACHYCEVNESGVAELEKVYRRGPNWCACTSVTTVKPAWRPLRPCSPR